MVHGKSCSKFIKSGVCSSILLVLIFLAGTVFVQAQKTPQKENEDLRTLVTLLDYVSKDYKMAVSNGQVIDDSEYAEQIEFAQRSADLQKKVSGEVNDPAFSGLDKDIQNLISVIKAKEKPELIAEIALGTKNKILDLGLLKISPNRWPSLQRGAALYQKSCATCHGDKGYGDGPAGKNLEPSPTDFHDKEDMDQLSPLLAYNVIKLGVEGTGMRAFSELTEDEIWDLSFYVSSLRYDKDKAVAKLPANLPLDSITKWRNQDLTAYLSKNHPEISTGAIRNFEPQREDPLDIANRELQLSYQLYGEGNYNQAGKHALSSYLEGIELVENILPKSLVRSLEMNMGKYRKAIDARDDKQVQTYFTLLQEEIGSAKAELSEIDYSFAFVYGASLSILLREALEALLIILIILRILKPLKIKKAEVALHAGWIVAIVLGFVSWLFVDKLVNLSGASREVMEGLGSIIAVLVLLYAGTWLHNHAAASKWTKFIKEKINTISESGNWFALGIFSFIIVFREAFEVVLFLSSLTLNDTQEGNSALLWAVLTAALIIIAITYVFLKTTKKLPISKIFKISAFVIALLAIVLAGKGVHALQEAGYIAVTGFRGLPQFDLLGIFPTLQTLGAQLFVLLIIIFFSNRSKWLPSAKEKAKEAAKAH